MHFKVGDKVISIIHGYGEVSAVKPKVRVKFQHTLKYYYLDGRCYEADLRPEIYPVNSGIIKIDTTTIEVDQLIWVGNSGKWWPRYFARFEKDEVCCWQLGATSKTTNSTTKWSEYRLEDPANGD